MNVIGGKKWLLISKTKSAIACARKSLIIVLLFDFYHENNVIGEFNKLILNVCFLV